jgi:hypothetical protein
VPLPSFDPRIIHDPASVDTFPKKIIIKNSIGMNEEYNPLYSPSATTNKKQKKKQKKKVRGVKKRDNQVSYLA